MRKMLINKQMYTVVSDKEYIRRMRNNPEITEELNNETAIEKNGYVYPIIPSNVTNTTRVGMRVFGPVIIANKPTTEEDKETYSSKHILDFEHAENLDEVIRKTAKLEQMEKTILVNKDSIYNIVINHEDTPEFALLKEAINKKQIDINSYRSRFDDSFSNNMRLLSTSNSITFGKLRAFANAFDIEAELILRDKPNCVNPINEELRTIVTE